MFFPERMQRIRLLVYHPVRSQAVKKLHELGAVQITNFSEKLSQGDEYELLSAYPVSSDIRRLMTQVMSVNRLLDIFAMVDSEESEGFFKSLFAPAPPLKIPIENLTGEALLSEVESAVTIVDEELSAPLERLQKLQEEAVELVSQQKLYKRINLLPVPLDMLGGGPWVYTVLGIAPRRDWGELQTELEAATKGVSASFVNDLSETECSLLVVSLVADADKVLACLRKSNIERIIPNHVTGTPMQVLAQITARLSAIEQELTACRAQISAMACQWRLRLRALRELLAIERERAEAYSNFAKTDQVVAIEGWVAAKRASFVVMAMEDACSGLVATLVTEPDEPANKVPVVLNNPGLLKHFEWLVKLYAPPKYDEIDPTILICPTMVIFFGLMITDVMYGLMTMLLGIFILRGGGRYYPLYYSAGMLLTLGGISSMVLGALTGGWFGNLASHYLGLSFLNSIVVLNPMVDVGAFLLLAIAIGVLHLNMGAMLNIIKNLRNDNLSGAFKYAWIFLLEIAIVLYYYHLTVLAMFFGISGLLFLLYAEKGMALFGITGLLGDSLSYARLMALGLVGFGLAMAINALAMMVWDASYLGWFLALLILVGGHLFSHALTLIGAFAHGIRLHFVEFFGKFYSGGGENFEPFRIKREITIEKLK